MFALLFTSSHLLHDTFLNALISHHVFLSVTVDFFS